MSREILDHRATEELGLKRFFSEVLWGEQILDHRATEELGLKVLF